MDYYNDYAYKREQVKDYLREAEQDRLARQLPRRTGSFDWRCFVVSRTAFLAAQLRHVWQHVHKPPREAESGPVLADCR